MYFDVDTAITECPVNIMPLIDDTDFKTIEGAVAYNAAGMALYWHFVTSAGAYTLTAVTPTTAGNYDWTDQGAAGIYTIEIPASGGASINNDTEGYGWFTGVCTGVLPWRGPVIGFREAAINDALCDGGDNLDVNTVQWLGTACATPTVAGVPEVDLTHVAGATTNVSALATNVDAILTDTAVIGAAGAGLTALATQASVNTIDDFLDTEIAAILADTNELQTDWVNGGRLDLILDIIAADTTTDIPALIATAQADLDNIQTRLPTVLVSGTSDSGSTTTLVDAARTEATTDHWRGMVLVMTSGTNAGLGRLITGFNAATDTITVSPAFPASTGTGTYEIWPASDAILAQITHTSAVVPTVTTLTGHTPQTGDSFARIGATGSGLTSLATQASVTTIDDFLDTEIAAILAAVDTEIASILALLDDARGEPAQGAPPVNPDAMTKIDYLYKAFRNKITQTATTLSIYDDAGTTVDHKATVSDDATTYTRGEIATGP
jgi:hypothetical protein